MKKLLKNALDYFIITIVVVLVAVLIGGCISYDKERYHRKYPETTTGDYIWDKVFSGK